MDTITFHAYWFIEIDTSKFISSVLFYFLFCGLTQFWCNWNDVQTDLCVHKFWLFTKLNRNEIEIRTILLFIVACANQSVKALSRVKNKNIFIGQNHHHPFKYIHFVVKMSNFQYFKFKPETREQCGDGVATKCKNKQTLAEIMAI